MPRHGGICGEEGITRHDDVLVTGAAALCRDDVRKVGWRQLVHHADEAFEPTVFVVFGRRWLCCGRAKEGRLLRERKRARGRGGGYNGITVVAVIVVVVVMLPETRVGEARFRVRDAGEVKGEAEGRHDDIELR